jgi:holo-[acyl-carrier protein] synthase
MVGIGTDLVKIARIQSLFERFGHKFVGRILSYVEQVLFQEQHQSVHFLAKRFAGKEAVAKALGCGIGARLAFTEISIINEKNGKPIVKLLGKAELLVQEMNISEVMISLSDERDYAMAFALATK